MLFGRKKEKDIAEDIERGHIQQTFRSLTISRFKQNRMALWSIRILIFIALIAIFADVFSNEKPLYCKFEGQIYFPVFQQYLVDLGLYQWPSNLINADWRKLSYDSSIFPIVPYSANTQDFINSQKSPFGPQQVEGLQNWHWLGTDFGGRDILAIMIHGARSALLVGIISMFIASVIGIFLGALAGYFGDNRLKSSVTRIILNILGLFFGIFYGFQARRFSLQEADGNGPLLWGIGIVLLFMFIFNFIAFLLEKIPILKKEINLPVDLLVMRFLEIMNSIPSLLLLLAIIPIIRAPSLYTVMIIIGLLRWTGIARFTRAELLKIRNLEYIEAARAIGLKEWQIIIRHALPNALTPVLITIAFGIASSILLEAAISFLNIGLNSQTWGALLSSARKTPSAWWLAIFPGLAIFVTVTIFNLIGEGLTEALRTGH